MDIFLGGRALLVPQHSLWCFSWGHILTSFPAMSPSALHLDLSAHPSQTVSLFHIASCICTFYSPCRKCSSLSCLTCDFLLLICPKFPMIASMCFLQRDIQCSSSERPCHLMHSYVRVLNMMHSNIFLNKFSHLTVVRPPQNAKIHLCICVSVSGI